MTEYTITREKPVIWPYALMLVLLSLFAVAFVSFYYAEDRFAQSAEGMLAKGRLLLQDKQTLQEEREYLQKQSNEQKRKIAEIDQKLDISEAVEKQLAQQIVELQNANTDLKEKLALYQAIMSPPEGKLGLNLHRVRVQNLRDNQFNIDLTLIQSGRHDLAMSGTLSFTVVGIDSSGEKSISMKNLISSGDVRLKYKFQFWQRLAEMFELPVGFTPARLVVYIKQAGQLRKLEYNWRDIAV